MANALLDFLQGASNSAAANVSAPIDGIAWLLRKAGINVDRPVMGSDWMRERGLTAEPQNKLAGILGESVGGVLPMVTTAKAPQIAQGLLQAERNLAAPRTLNPQTGAILWHGSPHKFDAFDSSKIGTGEGAQAYGHGLYLADAPEVAQNYAQTLGRDSAKFRSKADELASWAYSVGRDSEVDAAKIITDEINRLEYYGKFGSKIKKADYDSALKIVESKKLPTAGNFYKVDLPDEHIAKMLDWDKPISEQPENIKRLFSNNVTRKRLNTGGIETMPVSFNGKTTYEFSNGFNGQDLYETLANNLGADEAAQLLKQQGVTGMRYLDGGSRGTGAGTSNYVVFPGNEGLLSILERNGQPIK